MLPVLFTIGIPEGWGVPVALLVALAVTLVRAVALVRSSEGGGRITLLAALRSDVWFIGLLAVAIAIAYRAGALSGALRLPLHTYGLLLAAGFLVGVILAQREGRRRGQDAERIGDLTFWILIAALVGSQVLYVLLNLEDFTGASFFADPPFTGVPRVLVFWRVGLAFYGGFIGAALASLVYMRRHGMPFLAYADTLIPSVAFGHFLGRVGCFAAGCCWGSLAHDHVPWAVRFGPGSDAYGSFLNGSYPARFFSSDRLTTALLHPAQLYDAFGELAIFLALVLVVRPRKRFHGQVFATWLVAYAVLRGVVELFRGDLERQSMLGLNSGQWTSVAILAVGVVLWLSAPRPAVDPTPATV